MYYCFIFYKNHSNNNKGYGHVDIYTPIANIYPFTKTSFIYFNFVDILKREIALRREEIFY